MLTGRKVNDCTIFTQVIDESWFTGQGQVAPHTRLGRV
jgi:hypothetical protein